MANIKLNDIWETPVSLYESGVKLAGFNPLLDVCATHETAKCSNYYGPDKVVTAQQDALNIPWKMDFFCNPPYSEVDKWIVKGIHEVRENNVSGLFLTYAKTDTKWWHEFVEPHRDDFNGNIQAHFIKGRIKFLINGVIPKYCPKCKKRYYEEIEYCPNFLESGDVCGWQLNENCSPYGSVWLVIK